MEYGLSPSQVNRYQEEGFLFPVEVMTSAEAQALRDRLEQVEQRFGPDLDIAQYLRNHPQLTLPMIDQVTRHPRILDAVSAILGPDLLVWGCSFFTKEPKGQDFVSWHQDLTYWGLDSTDEITAWLALSPSTPESGCMRFVAGSHKQDIVAHQDTFAETNLLSRGQELAVEVDEGAAVQVVLQPGQMSLHHGRMFHASGPNRSTDRRIGLAIRYISLAMRQTVGQRDSAMLVRGEDRYGHFELLPRPTGDFTPEAVALQNELVRSEGEYFYAGVES